MSVSGQTAAGVTVPDTKLARQATELVRGATSDLIYHHSRRVYWWGSLQGRNRGLSFDPELLYIGAMFHDLGLNEQFRGSGRRFEVDSADFAFDVIAPPDTRLRVVMGASGTRPFVGTFELQDEVPGQAMSMRLGAQADPVQVISFSAVADGDAAVATIAVRYRGPRGAGRDRLERRLAGWLSGLREVAEGDAPDPGPGMPESLRVRCMPGAPCLPTAGPATSRGARARLTRAKRPTHFSTLSTATGT